MGEYQTINTTENAASKSWCINLIPVKPEIQASVNIGGNKYQYASKFNVQKGDVAVIGIKNWPESQGEMGIVESTQDKVTLSRNHISELAFVFTDHADEQMIAACAKYISLPGDKVDRVEGSDTFATSFKVRKLLAAVCILAYPQLATPDDLKLAKNYIASKQTLDDIPYSSHNIFYFLDFYGAKSPKLGDDGEIYGDELRSMDKTEKARVNGVFNRRVFCDAVAVMLRGGFVNLLEAFFSAKPPVKGFYNTLIKTPGNAFIPAAMDVLKANEPVK